MKPLLFFSLLSEVSASPCPLFCCLCGQVTFIPCLRPPTSGSWLLCMRLPSYHSTLTDTMVFMVFSGRWISREWVFQHSCWIPKAERTAPYTAGFGWSLTKKSYPTGAFLPLSRVAHCVFSGLHVSLHIHVFKAIFFRKNFIMHPRLTPNPSSSYLSLPHVGIIGSTTTLTFVLGT